MLRTELNDGRQLSLQLITSGSYRNSLHPTNTPLPLPPPSVPFCAPFRIAGPIQHAARHRWPGEHKNYCLQLGPRAHGNVLNSVWKWLYERVYGMVGVIRVIQCIAI